MVLTTSGVQISMVSSAEHSFQRGYERLQKGLREDNPYHVKESLIWVHHGVELSLKQLLVERIGEYLVFEDIDNAIRKVENLRHDCGMTEASSLQLFEHTAVRTVGYRRLLSRVAVMLDIGELARGTTLRNNLKELGKLRNEIVHSPSEIDIESTADLLVSIGKPLFDIITCELGDSGPTYAAQTSIRGSMTSAERLAADYAPQQTESEKRILTLAQKFQGQPVPGSLFGREGEFTLPDFSQADIRRDPGYSNFLVESEDDQWLICVMRGYANKEQMLVKKQIAGRLGVDQLWVARATTHPYSYPDALISSQEDVDRLEEILTQ